MPPFSKRTHGPELFTHQLLVTGEKKNELKRIWETLFTPKLLSTILGTSKEQTRILSYQPNLASRQFGISQTVPRLFFKKKSELCLSIIDYSEDDYLQRISLHANGHPTLTPFDFEPSYYCIQDFGTWWRAYHTKEFMDAAIISQHLTDAFSSLQPKFDKGRSKHRREIQDF